MDPNLKAAAQKELLKRKAMAELQRRKTMQPEQPPMSLEGSAKALGTGVAEGTLSLGGMAGDLQNLLIDKPTEWALGKMGYSPEQAQTASAARRSTGTFGGAPTTEQLTGMIESQTGPMYKPQNIGEDYLRTIGQFAPAALAGPGGAGRKAAMTLIPAASSETAGQLTEGSEAEPYARLAGALGGGLVAAGRGGNAAKQMRKAAPDLQTVGRQTDAAYQRLRGAGIQFDDNAYRSFAMTVVDKLRKHGWRPRDGDPISGDLKEIVARVGKPNNWDEIENLRQFVGNLPTNASAKDFARAGIIRDELDKLVDSGKLISTKGLDPAIVGTMAKQARELGRKNIIGKKIAKMQDKSEWYLGGEESGLRNQVASFGKKQSLEPAEKAAFQKVVKREGILNALNSTGSRMGQIVLGGAGLATGGVPGAIATMAAHLVARKGSEAITKKALKDAMATVLAGRPAQKAAMNADKLTAREIMARRLIAGTSGQGSAANH